MNFDLTAGWHWPQWTMLILIALRLVLHSTNHGQKIVQSSGDEKGEPLRYNGFGALSHFALMMFILICGGFFS